MRSKARESLTSSKSGHLDEKIFKKGKEKEKEEKV